MDANTKTRLAVGIALLLTLAVFGSAHAAQSAPDAIDPEALAQLVPIRDAEGAAWARDSVEGRLLAFRWTGAAGGLPVLHNPQRRQLAVIVGVGDHDCPERLWGQRVRYDGRPIGARLALPLDGECGIDDGDRFAAALEAWTARLQRRGFRALESAVVGRAGPIDSLADTILQLDEASGGGLLLLEGGLVSAVDARNREAQPLASIELEEGCDEEECLCPVPGLDDVVALGDGRLLVILRIEEATCHTMTDFRTVIVRLPATAGRGGSGRAP